MIQGSGRELAGDVMAQEVKEHKWITTGEFLAYFESVIGVETNAALKKGILLTEDVYDQNLPITRRTCAGIYHRILLTLLKEQDEEDWSAALVLRDLYDCNRCVRHIAQIYAKGILGESSKGLFGVSDGITFSEMEDSFHKILDPSLRVKPEKRQLVFGQCSLEELKRIAGLNERCVIADVRDAQSFLEERLFEKCVNIPLLQLSKNPYCISEDRDIPIYLLCSKGYQSSVAAELLTRYGYSRVYVVD